MIKLKLTRTGKKHQAHFRIVAQEARSKRDGKSLGILGYYNPRTIPPTIKLDIERVEEWISKGAQPTDTVANIINRAKTGNKPRKRPERDYKKIKAKKKEKSEEEPKEKAEKPAQEKEGKPKDDKKVAEAQKASREAIRAKEKKEGEQAKRSSKPAGRKAD